MISSEFHLVITKRISHLGSTSFGIMDVINGTWTPSNKYIRHYSLQDDRSSGTRIRFVEKDNLLTLTSGTKIPRKYYDNI